MTFQLSGSAPELYESVMVPLWFAGWAEALITLVDPQPGEHLLDVACGTGVTTRLACDAVTSDGTVIGLDINPGMLDKARQLAGDRPIQWMQSDVTGTALPADHYDAILSQHGYHYFPDKPAALAEFHRVLKPGGRLALSIWDGHSPYTEALCHAVETHISAETAAKQRSQRQTPSAEALADQLRTAGYRDVDVIRQSRTIAVPTPEEFIPLHLGSMPIAAAFQALPDETKDRLIADVAAALSGHVTSDGLSYDDAVHVATGRK